ncbi:acyltransferase family protein [Gallaecimonas mangrovi]|uniref:acyltransferase family protein n=1 Tax=Gallaecimonas mangrovi TaxID=2291597 RepID=UPI0018673C0D|nr:acyltransferase [Gallaecimonas mangrovi]
MSTFNDAIALKPLPESASPAASPASSGRLLEFDLLRGLAIVFIVLGHSVVNSGHGFPVWLENLVRGGTGVFVFISGFFFQRIFFKRFDYKDFMVKKTLNVFLPFLCVSLVGLVLEFFGGVLIDGDTGKTAFGALWPIVQNGYVLFPHWYIPFIMLTFLCSPLHMQYIRLPLQAQLGTLLVFSIVAIYLQRPLGNADPLQSLVYFTPFYLLGILYSQHLSWFRLYYRYLFWVALVAVVVTVWLQSQVWFHIGNYHKAAFKFGGVDLQFIQKMGLCIVLIGLCERLIFKALCDHLVMLANLSFAIFFLHPLLAMVWGNVKYSLIRHGLLVPSHTLAESLFQSTLLFLFMLYGTVLMIKLLKPRLGDKSRMLIGC